MIASHQTGTGVTSARREVPWDDYVYNSPSKLVTPKVCHQRNLLLRELRQYERSVDVMELRNQLSHVSQRCFRYPHGLVLCKTGFRKGFAPDHPASVSHKTLHAWHLPTVGSATGRQAILEELADITKRYAFDHSIFTTANREEYLKFRFKILALRIGDALGRWFSRK